MIFAREPCIFGPMNVRSFFLFVLFLSGLTSCLGMGIQEPAPVTAYGQKNGAGSAGMHNVIEGDTLYSIARRYRLPMRDIAVVNKLNAPFVLHEGERLRLPRRRNTRCRRAIRFTAFRACSG